VSTAAPDPVPQRIGDAERDEAAGYLRDHLAAGRLDQSEFEDRVSRALGAKFARDLEPLFSDLPAPRFGADAPPLPPRPWEVAPVASVAGATPARRSGSAVPARVRAGKVLAITSAAIWPLVILAVFWFGRDFWWLIFLPIALSSVGASLTPKPGRRHSGFPR